jgi:hypothetical protein
VSYNSANEITYSLYPSDGKGGYSKTALEGHNGATLIAAVAVIDNDFTATSGQHTQEFEITGVPAGTYELVIMKKNHVDFTVTDIEVVSGDVNLTDEGMNSSVQEITMGVGDVNGDGVVSFEDVNKVAGYSKYGSTDVARDDYDVDGNGVISFEDVNVIASKAWYGSTGETYFVVSAKAAS